MSGVERHRGTGPTSGDDGVRSAAREVYAGILDRAPEHDFAPTLDRVRAVCELLGDPQRAFRVVHLTGTNGKTSTSRMVERLIREHPGRLADITRLLEHVERVVRSTPA